MSKADNMLAILWLLKSRRRMTAKQLAEQLELHIRTVYRNIDALCVAGVPIVSETGRDGGYFIPDSFKLDPLFFDGEEQKALIQAAAFAREAGYPSQTDLDRAVAKIKRYANPKQLERMEYHETSLEVIQPVPDSNHREALKEIEAGIALQTSLEIDYQSGYDGDRTKRIIDPYGLVHWRSKWYTVGYCHLRGEIRSFRLDRIVEIRRSDSGFLRPAHFSAREFLLDSLSADESNPEHERVSVHIRGSAHALDDLCAHWLMNRALVRRSTDEAHFKLDEHNLYTQLPYYLLSFGGKIRVEEPQELRACMAENAAALLAYYET